ncbi:MAG: hypothetical protein DI536_11550 [Archangium gephyra]|uniref:DUF4154 domain-containing protein n=1 Tax=Archangium gephyra TaxID=48 RepID=A0A2W5VD65_9BACT|nr:MAG: hypothetical protein DI536_11550 [Archangium gephyra]
MRFRGLAAAVLIFGSTSLAAGGSVDLQAALPVLLKVLTYDVNFDARGAGPFVVLVVSEPGQSAARSALVGDLKEAAVTEIKKRPLKYVPVDFRDEGQLQVHIDKNKASALLLVPGAPHNVVKALWDAAQDNQLYALALDAETVQTSFPVGVTMVGDKPQIVINEKSSKAVGARFETVVLRLAKVIQ